jgi:hypothetical protein
MCESQFDYVCVCYDKLLFYGHMSSESHGECNMNISRSWVNDVIILCQGMCTCVIFADMMTYRGLMAFNADKINNFMRGIKGSFASTTCAVI